MPPSSTDFWERDNAEKLILIRGRIMQNNSVGIVNFVHKAILVFTGILVCIPICIPTSVSAQEALEEIVVTARQREERLQDTPVAISAFSEQQIEQKFIQDLRDLGRYAPNVAIGVIPGFRSASIAIRGVSIGDIPSSFDPAVTVVVDDFFMGEYETALLNHFDLQQVEILRGPQGTLFGKNTIGGVVKVTTKRPGDEFGVEGRVQIGNYGRTDVSLALDAPLSPGKVTSRIAVFSQQSDGYATNTVDGSDFGGDDVLAARARLLFTPSEDFDALFTFEYVKDRSDTPPLIHTSTCNDEQGFYGGDLFCGAGRGADGGVPLGDPFHVGLVDVSEHAGETADGTPHALNGLSDTEGGHRADIYGLYLNMNWAIGPGVITSVTGFRSVETDQYNDYFGETVPIYSTIRSVHRETTSQELRFASNPSDSFDYVVGAYYQVNDLLYRNSTDLGPDFGGSPFLLIDGDGSQDSTTLGLFAEANFHVTDRTQITAGARYSDDDKDFNLRPIGVPEAGRVIVDNSWENTTYRLIVNHRFSDTVMAYGSFSTGFKSGGFNEQATQPLTAVLSFDEEEADSFEIGLKTDLQDGRLRLNLAAFTVEYEGLQLDAVVPVVGSPIGQESVITNAGKATVNGFEAELQWLATEALMFEATLGLLDAEYDKFDCNLDGDVGNGNEDCSVLSMKRIPDMTASGGVTFTHDAFGGGSGAFNIDFTYTDEFYNDIFNTQASRHEDVTLLNASWTFRTASEKYRISIFGRNLTDEIYQDSGLGVANLWSFSTYGAPLTYGVEFGFDL
jgi:iron complex outermembrane receptor protein